MQRLVYMLDASLWNSFFSRKANGKIIGMESNLGWHSEDRGVFMINQDYKLSDTIKNQLQEFELSVLAGEKGNDLEDMGAGDVHMDMIADVGDGHDNMEVLIGDGAANNSQYVREGQLDHQYRKM